jgi:prolyl oligopeptidase
MPCPAAVRPAYVGPSAVTFLLLLAAPAAPAPAVPGLAGPPLAEKRPVVDEYWGTEITDDYRWLETLDDPEVLGWAEEQHARTRAALDAWPHREALAARIQELVRHETSWYWNLAERGDRLFAMKEQPPKQQPFLVLLSSFRPAIEERTIVDPNVLDPDGGTSIDFYEPSPDGRYVAVSLSEDGTEDGTLFLWNVVTGEKLDDSIPRVNGGTAGGSVAWTAASDGFFYSRYPYPGERPAEDLPFYQQIWFHRLGDPLSADRYALGETFPRIAEIEMETSDDGRWIVAEVSNGDGGEYEYWLHGPEGRWRKFAAFEDWVQSAHFGADGELYLLSRKDAPMRKILRVSPESPDLAEAEVVVPESDGVIQSFAAGTSRLWVQEILGGPSRLRVVPFGDSPRRTVNTGEVSRIGWLTRLVGDRLLYRRETFTTPPAWYELGPDDDTPWSTALVTTSAADYAGCVAERISATADDGTKIPINLIMRGDTPRDGTAPCLLYAYGSYGSSQTPRFRAHRLAWIEQGGIFAVANIRGGGEYGDDWHRAANLGRKKTSMDDLGACARHLAEAGWTAVDRLAIQGGSAGGLLVYGTAAHYPDRMTAVISNVGVADVLRSETAPNGEFNITEFGTVHNEHQFPGMLAASPYHQVRDGVTYPAVLSTTGMNDPRVPAWHPFKMTARFQATGSPNRILLRVSFDTGHGGGTSLSAWEARLVDEYTFLFDQLGIRYREN